MPPPASQCPCPRGCQTTELAIDGTIATGARPDASQPGQPSTERSPTQHSADSSIARLERNCQPYLPSEQGITCLRAGLKPEVICENLRHFICVGSILTAAVKGTDTCDDPCPR
jgi:hypothetical protein